MNNTKNQFPVYMDKKGIIISCFFLLLSSGIGVFMLIPVKGIIKEVFLSVPDRTQIFILSSILFFCIFLKSIFYILTYMISHLVSFKLMAKIRLEIVAHMEKLGLLFFHKRKSGELAKIINFDVEQIELFLAHGLPELASSVFAAVITAIILFYIDPRLCIAMLCVIPFLLMFSKFLGKIWENLFEKYFMSLGKMSEELMEYISGISVVKAFASEESRTDKLMKTIDDYNKYLRKMSFSMVFPACISGILLESGIVILAGTGVWLLSKNIISIYDLGLAVFLGTIFCSSLSKFSLYRYFGIVFFNSVSNINSVLDEEIIETKTREAPEPGDIVFENIDFSYDGKKDVLKNISLKIKKGSFTSLTGMSGAGKSSAAGLITGFFSPHKGRILISGTDVRIIGEKQLSDLVCLVSQDVFLFNTTIMENIRIGSEYASDEDVFNAAEKAGIHDFILSLPKGYKTIAGEKGARLSGGQKQRITIARTILKDSPIIIFDEALSSIDPENREIIKEGIKSLGPDKTIINISHDLNSVKESDDIHLFHEGELAGSGSHEELLEKNEIYRFLWKEKETAGLWTIKEGI